MKALMPLPLSSLKLRMDQSMDLPDAKGKDDEGQRQRRIERAVINGPPKAEVAGESHSSANQSDHGSGE